MLATVAVTGSCAAVAVTAAVGVAATVVVGAAALACVGVFNGRKNACYQKDYTQKMGGAVVREQVETVFDAPPLGVSF